MLLESKWPQDGLMIDEVKIFGMKGLVIWGAMFIAGPVLQDKDTRYIFDDMADTILRPLHNRN